MKKIRAAVVGYGNIGHFTVEALEAAPDFEIAGIVRPHPQLPRVCREDCGHGHPHRG